MSEPGCNKDGSDPKIFESSEAVDFAEALALATADLESDILSIWARVWLSCFEPLSRSCSTVMAPAGNCGLVLDDAGPTLRNCLTLATCREQ